MSDIRTILDSPHKRTLATYRFKVTTITGNTVHYHDASMVTNTQEFPQEGELTLEEQYQDDLDNLFIVVNLSGEYYFTRKVSNNRIWPNFNKY